MNHGTENKRLDRRLQVLFGADAHSETPLAQSGAGFYLPTGLPYRTHETSARSLLILAKTHSGGQDGRSKQ